MNAIAKIGTVRGVGLGPGAQDLLSVRADRLVRTARHVAYFRKAGRPGQARRIVEGMLRADAAEIPMEYPVTTEIPVSDPRYNACLAAFYADCAAKLAELALGGEDVAVLCEGDPFFYGSFMYLYARLAKRVRVEVVPGVSSLMACAVASGGALAARNDVLTVIPAPLPEPELKHRLGESEAAAIIKLGRHMPKVRKVLDELDLTSRARYVEHATLESQKVMRLTDLNGATVPYFSMLLVHKRGEAWA